MPEVVAIMANWNGGAVAVASARSVVAQTAGVRLVVVDNASADGSADAIAAACPDAVVIRNAENLGYAAANNQALRAFPDAEFYLLVNNDVILPDPDGLAAVVRRMRADPAARGACGRYEYPDGRFQHFYSNLPSPLDVAVYWGGLRHVPGMLRSAGMRRYFAHDRDLTRPTTLDQPAFACVLLRGDAARAVGLMDERFPIFFNDIDYCRRWRDRGWTWQYYPDWRVVHHHSASVKKRPGLLAAEQLSSAARYAWKHFGPVTAAVVHLSLLAEAGWRKYRHGDLTVPLSDIARCRTFYCQPGQPAGRP